MQKFQNVKLGSQKKKSSEEIKVDENVSLYDESDVDTESSILEDAHPKINISLIKNIATTINGITTQTESEIKKRNLHIKKDCPFYNEKIPGISIENYLYRIKLYTELEDSTLVLSLIYIDRLSKETNLLLTKHNIYRIIFTAVLIAIKYNEDSIYTNKFYAKIGGVSNKELNRLERKFVDYINFKIFVSDKELQIYYNYLKNFE